MQDQEQVKSNIKIIGVSEEGERESAKIIFEEKTENFLK